MLCCNKLHEQLHLQIHCDNKIIMLNYMTSLYFALQGFPPPPPNENVPIDDYLWVLGVAAVLLIVVFTILRNRKKLVF